MRAWLRVCVVAWVRGCVCASVRVCVRVCVRPCTDVCNSDRQYSFFFLSSDPPAPDQRNVAHGNEAMGAAGLGGGAAIDLWIDMVEEATRRAVKSHRLSVALSDGQARLASMYRCVRLSACLKACLCVSVCVGGGAQACGCVCVCVCVCVRAYG